MEECLIVQHIIQQQKKLERATYAGGLIGELGYLASHKKELSMPSRSRNHVHGVTAYIGTEKHRKNIGISRNALKRKALAASADVIDARENLSKFGKLGYGKTAKRYRNAQINARNATRAYYDSLSKKQYERLRRNHIG